MSGAYSSHLLEAPSITPRLGIVDLKSNRATVVMNPHPEFDHSMSRDAARILYRTTICAEDDQQPMEWINVDWKLTTDRMTILGLRANTTYSIYGLYQGSMDKQWSEPSNIIHFTTRKSRSEIEMATMVFVYWLRCISQNVSPGFLVELMVRYYCVPQFAWDPHKAGHGMELSHDGLTFNKAASGRATVLSRNLLTSSNVNVVNWEITIRPGQHQTYFLMGYVVDNGLDVVNADLLYGFADEDSDVPGFIGNDFIGNAADKEELALYVVDGSNPMIYSKGNMGLIHSKWTWNIQSGDRLRLRFDWRRRECTAFWNDDFVGIVTSELPRKIYPAASAFYSGSFETTLFEVR